MDAKATWVKDLEKREQEILLLRKEQIIREGEVYQREQRLHQDQEALKYGYESLEKQKKLSAQVVSAMLADTEALGVFKGRDTERAKCQNQIEQLQKELDARRDRDIEMLKGLLNTAIAALQANIKVERS